MQSVLTFNVCRYVSEFMSAYITIHEKRSDNSSVYSYFKPSNASFHESFTLENMNAPVVALEYVPMLYVSKTVRSGSSIRIYMICDRTIKEEGQFFFNGSMSEGYNIYFRHESCNSRLRLGCPTAYVEAIWTFTEDYFIIYGLIMIAVGALYLFLGLKQWKASKMISVVLLVYIVACAVLYTTVVHNPTKDPIQFIILSTCLHHSSSVSLTRLFGGALFSAAGEAEHLRGGTCVRHSSGAHPLRVLRVQDGRRLATSSGHPAAD
eukprot:TRINITY_DN12382_c0_g2_i1.p1 TRINITY_DN12382_c0_g2~~TRINITY_DN12382_c0_g2_i1.p1  ORF type:complete len:264 (-),score=24.66 TRINITY_DN12382_c0_g2_i1:104-895(-)